MVYWSKRGLEATASEFAQSRARCPILLFSPLFSLSSHLFDWRQFSAYLKICSPQMLHFISFVTLHCIVLLPEPNLILSQTNSLHRCAQGQAFATGPC